MKPAELFDLSGKVAIITGGANGIGKGCSKMLAAHGASVVVADLWLEAAQATAAEIRRAGGQAMAVACNVLKDEELTALVDNTLAEYGQINILVNNVGGGGAGRESPATLTVEEFARTFELNVFSNWRLAQLCAPHMEKAGYGSIINISSMSSINKSPAISAYASSKAAINHMTANLAFDYGPAGIRVNAVGPGAVRTDALASVLTPEIEARMLAHTPLRRLGEVEDIAGAVLYFAAPVSCWVSGQTLFVNGGGVQTLD
ncbi:glucose 1-dehydrogenase [Oceanimonas baumannii]|uniref:7-alpha-hydroxysteroid dehydrogenase n=1 Tax=Oceanimonas baumannii TaxID=129578 RepID=A0A235CM17_9GAMM|nr:glucose 1-dehydrogenase [Oceanimonas baumannii]OYD25067.1 7-alpha-hydroxysteroid dehydrogenase [Oceanimonas baumannii]TDW59848.1 7-alpha-hydroxysteroid dehydrogenase [Oceanimonas baumannii]